MKYCLMPISQKWKRRPRHGGERADWGSIFQLVASGWLPPTSVLWLPSGWYCPPPGALCIKYFLITTAPQLTRGFASAEWMGQAHTRCRGTARRTSPLTQGDHRGLQATAKRVLRTSRKEKNEAYFKSKILGMLQWLNGWASAFGSGHDPRVLGSSPESGYLHGACFSLFLCLCLSLCVSHK